MSQSNWNERVGRDGYPPHPLPQDPAPEAPGLGDGEDNLPPDDDLPARIPRLMTGHRKGQRALAKPIDAKSAVYTPEQRLLILDVWKRSNLPGKDFAPIVGIGKQTLYLWKKRFEEDGPAGLMDKQKGCPKGSRLSEITKRTILMLKEQHPDWGCQRITDMLVRGPALAASPNAVALVLKEAGYQTVHERTRPHPDKPRRFERAKPGQLWQTDIFTFVLKRQNRRVHLVGFMDDHSRFITAWGLFATASAANVIETFEAGISSYGPPQEILTDNGSQYITWRGKSAFAKVCEKRGIRQIVSKPRHPQTLGKIERFWGTLWREFIETAIFIDLNDARERIRHFVDYYNFQRPHQGIDGLVPADRFFEAAPDVKDAIRKLVDSNALSIARNGTPKDPFYIAGNVGGKSFSVHAEGERMILTPEGGERREIEWAVPDAIVNASKTDEFSAGRIDDNPSDNEDDNDDSPDYTDDYTSDEPKDYPILDDEDDEISLYDDEDGDPSDDDREYEPDDEPDYPSDDDGEYEPDDEPDYPSDDDGDYELDDETADLPESDHPAFEAPGTSSLDGGMKLILDSMKEREACNESNNQR